MVVGNSLGETVTGRGEDYYIFREKGEGKKGLEGDGAALTHITAIFSPIVSLNGEHLVR